MGGMDGRFVVGMIVEWGGMLGVWDGIGAVGDGVGWYNRTIDSR